MVNATEFVGRKEKTSSEKEITTEKKKGTRIRPAHDLTQILNAWSGGNARPNGLSRDLQVPGHQKWWWIQKKGLKVIGDLTQDKRFRPRARYGNA